LRRAHLELEQQVLDRTEALARANEELRIEMDEREHIENKLKKSLEEKEILLKEIHHRVKNNLQIISSLLNLQSRYITDEKMLDIYKESQNRVKSMAIIHEKLYQSKDLAKIDFGDYVKSLILDLFHSYGVEKDLIQLDVNIKDILLDINTAIPCGLIVNELVTNSIKHGFSLHNASIGHNEIKDKISVNVSEDDEFYTMTIYDNGVGFPKDLNFQNTDSLGMQLVINLANQLKGTVELKKEDGTLFTVNFKELKM